MKEKQLLILFIFVSLFISCNSGYEQNINALSGKRLCLNIRETENKNKINIGKGILTFNRDKTFTITNDSAWFSNISGEWDLCCSNEWGEYVFEPQNHIRQITLLPEFEIKIDNKIYQLVFTSCE